MKNVYLAGSVRTPIGRFGGTLASWTAADLGVAVAKESLATCSNRSRPSSTIDLGLCATGWWWTKRRAPNHLSRRSSGDVAGIHGQSGVWFGSEGDHPRGSGDHAGSCDMVLAGGTESMSRVPYFAEGRAGACAWETRNSLMACIAMASTIRFQDW